MISVLLIGVFFQKHSTFSDVMPRHWFIR